MEGQCTCMTFGGKLVHFKINKEVMLNKNLMLCNNFMYTYMYDDTNL